LSTAEHGGSATTSDSTGNRSHCHADCAGAGNGEAWVGRGHVAKFGSIPNPKSEVSASKATIFDKFFSVNFLVRC